MIKTENATDRQLVAAWNILQFSGRCLGNKEGLSEKVREVQTELAVRGIPHEAGKLIKEAVYG